MAKADVPKLWRAIQRGNQATLLHAEASLLRDLRLRTKRVVDDAALAAANYGASDTEAAKRAAIAATRGAIGRMQTVLEQAITAGRADARARALARLDVELGEVRRQLRKRGVDAQLTAPARSDGVEDTTAATATASSYASAWGSSVLAGVLSWADDPTGDVGVRVTESVRTTDFRLRRIATTEVAIAYNDEHGEALETIARENRDARWLPAVLKCWDATLDRKTCSTCSARAGDIVPVGMPFRGGDEPGHVHPHCRCIESLIFLPLRLEQTTREAAA